MPSYYFEIKIAVEILAKIGIIVIVEGLASNEGRWEVPNRASNGIKRKTTALSIAKNG
jgi:hypothetical protein